MHRGRSFGVVAMAILTAAPVVTSGCGGLCFHNDCGPRSVTVYLSGSADAQAARICFDGDCETLDLVDQVDLGGGRWFERALPEAATVDDADRVELAVTLLDGSGAERGTFTDEIDIDAGECECATVDITWDGTEFDRFN